jgi:hypothetical protein
LDYPSAAGGDGKKAGDGGAEIVEQQHGQDQGMGEADRVGFGCAGGTPMRVANGGGRLDGGEHQVVGEGREAVGGKALDGRGENNGGVRGIAGCSFSGMEGRHGG